MQRHTTERAATLPERESAPGLATGLKLLEISSYPPPRAGWGVRVSYLRRHVLEQGGDCQVLNIGKSRRTPSPEYVDVQGLGDYLRKVARFVRRGYLVHTHINGDVNKGWGLALSAELLARLWGRPCVLTMHAGPRQRSFPRERCGPWLPFYKSIFGLAQQIVCNNEAVKAGIREFGVPAEKIHPVQAFSRQYLDYEPLALAPELERFLDEHEPVAIVYFFLREEFFVDSLLRAVARLVERHPRFGLVAIGLDTRGQRFEGMLRDAGLRSSVFAAGDVEHDLFLTLLARAHFYLRTPAKDGVCSSVLEALSLGVPVVASHNGSRPASVIPFAADDAAALYEAVARSWEDYDRVRRAVVRPELPDTVAAEVALLLRAAGLDPRGGPR